MGLRFPSRKKLLAIALQRAWKLLKAACLLGFTTSTTAWMVLRLPGNRARSLPRQKNSVEVGWKPRKPGFLELPCPKNSTRARRSFSRHHFHARKSRWKLPETPAACGLSNFYREIFGRSGGVNFSRERSEAGNDWWKSLGSHAGQGSSQLPRRNDAWLCCPRGKGVRHSLPAPQKAHSAAEASRTLPKDQTALDH